MTTPPSSSAPSKLQWVILIAYLINTFGTFWSMTGKWTDGCTNSSQSDKYFTLITPPGWAFAIWGIIFAWEGLACLIAFFPCANAFSTLIVGNTFTLFWGLACLAQAVWPYTFCDNIGISWFVLLVDWIALVGLQQTSLAKLANLPTSTTAMSKVLAYVLLIAPFSLHLGWCTAATALNINASTVAAGNDEVTLITVALATIIFTTAMTWTFGVTGLSWTKSSCDPMMAAGVLWALNAVSHHDITKPIKTSSGATVFPQVVTTPLANLAVFIFWFLAAVLLLRLKVEGVIAIRRYVKARRNNCNNNAELHHVQQGEQPLLV